MDLENILKNLENDGYCVIPNVLSNEELSKTILLFRK